MMVSTANIAGLTSALFILLINYVQAFPQSWSYPGLWYYSNLPNLYHFRRQVHPPQQLPFSQIPQAPIPPSPPLPLSPPLLQQPRSILPPKRNTHSSMIHDRCEQKNWGNKVGKCRMSCNLYDGTCTETLITTDCGCNGELHVK